MRFRIITKPKNFKLYDRLRFYEILNKEIFTEYVFDTNSETLNCSENQSRRLTHKLPVVLLIVVALR